VIIITKIDLFTKEELTQLQGKMKYYEQFYDVYYVSSITKENTSDIKDIFRDKISVFAGQTGAGKSSLLNALNPEFDIETNEISKALGRGKHTTRQSDLLDLFEGLVADTPGFSKLDFFDIKVEEIPDCFIDFFELSHQCKFRGCTHLNEPKCKVKEEVENGNILRSRYRNYQLITEEIKSQKIKY
jgi:ribosome biogenesis GTPase